jgi:hypothetical protein
MPEYTFDASKLEDAIDRMHALNRRLEKARIPERFTWSHLTAESGVQEENGLSSVVRMVTFTVNQPVICYGGWEFVATATREGDGYVLHTVPGVNLGGWEPRVAERNSWCDHCQTDRARKLVYIIRHAETGRIVQVGSTCIALYLGVTPEGLWTLTYDLDDTFTDVCDMRTAERDYSVREVIALGWVMSEQGKNYVSYNRHKDTGEVSTSSLVKAAFGPLYFMKPEDRTWFESKIRDALAVPAHVIDAILESRTTVLANDFNSADYRRNLDVIAGTDYISYRSVGIAASLSAVYAHEVRRLAEVKTRLETRKANGEAGNGQHFGSAPTTSPKRAGTKVAGVIARVIYMRYVPNAYAGSTLIKFISKDGYALTWFASGTGAHDDLAVGDKVELTGGSVKAHDVYQDEPHTLITRVKFEVVERAKESVDA